MHSIFKDADHVLISYMHTLTSIVDVKYWYSDKFQPGLISGTYASLPLPVQQHDIVISLNLAFITKRRRGHTVGRMWLVKWQLQTHHGGKVS